ncbi:MAG TPA: NTP transferase domain-containing protein, partial [Pseudorhizobium sp.]|nr:NTP transferase domain-containing protein [Pseudorhizobium sp.]
THLLTVPVDAPFFTRDLASRLQGVVLGTDTIAVASSDGRTHPVFGLWPVSVADDLQSWLAQPENRRMSDFLARHRSIAVQWELIDTELGPQDPFMNLNTPADLESARRFLEAAA